MGQGGTGIGVSVQSCTECNSTPSRPRCPNFRVQRYGGTEIVLEFRVNGARRTILLEGNLVDI